MKAMLIGDSVAYGSIDGGRILPSPVEILNQNQTVFNFTSDYSRPGMSFSSMLSDNINTRFDYGLFFGLTLQEVLDAHTDCQAVLINLGGNDQSLSQTDETTLINNIKTVANTVASSGKIFCFIGVIDVNAKQSAQYLGVQNIYTSGLIQAAKNIASSAEILRQVCIIEGYPYIDIRKDVSVDLSNITSDIVHPTQEYYEKIFKTVVARIQQ